MQSCKIKQCECSAPIIGDWNSSMDDWFNNHSCKYFIKKYASFSVAIRNDIGYYFFGFSKYNYFAIYYSEDNKSLKIINPKININFNKSEDPNYYLDLANEYYKNII